MSGMTHYSYTIYTTPDGRSLREPTGIYDLSVTGERSRRQLLRALSLNGELLAKIPRLFSQIANMVQLRNALELEGLR